MLHMLEIVASSGQMTSARSIARLALLLSSLFVSIAGANAAKKLPDDGAQLAPPRPQVTVVENGESKARPEDCRGIIVGPGINQPDPFPGYAGFVGWESPIRLRNGTWLVGFNAG